MTAARADPNPNPNPNSNPNPNPNPNPAPNSNPNLNQVRLLHAACMMNGVRCAVPSGAAAQHALAAFKAEPELQVLLLSAQRDASGLTLTCARHVIVIEPQLDLATELQMIGRVHRIGQTRQTYVHRLCVDGSFEHSLASERQARSMPAHQ